VQLLTVIIGTFVAAFMVGWLGGYRKACRVHGWYLPEFDWRKDAVAPEERLREASAAALGPGESKPGKLIPRSANLVRHP
jgi:hypothetical protein